MRKLLLFVLAGVISGNVAAAKTLTGEAGVSLTVKSGTVTDIDGNEYATLVLGGQEWMAENLRVTRYNNGDPIPDGSDLGRVLPDQDYFFYPHNDPDLKAVYGLLYSDYVVQDERDLCPAGWQVPSHSQWQVLEMYLGMPWEVTNTWGMLRGQDEGGKLKAAGYERWLMPNVGATDEVGFGALPAGVRGVAFFQQAERASFFTSTLTSGGSNVMRYLDFNTSKIFYSHYARGTATSIRCIKVQEDESVPQLNTPEVISVASDFAVVEAEVLSDGNSEVLARGVVYGNFNNPVLHFSHFISITSNDAGTGAFTASLYGLLPGRTYYFRTYAVNANGVAYSDLMTFVTPAASLPALSALAVNEYDQHSINVVAEVLSEGGSDVTERGFVYAHTNGPNISHEKVVVGSGVGSFSAVISDLNPNTVYYVRAFATNEEGTTYNNQRIITTATDKPAPVVQTLDITEIFSDRATIRGVITDDFDIPLMQQGVRVTWAEGTFDFTVEDMQTEFSVLMSGLTPNTEYTARVFAVNENGRSYGDRISFFSLFETADQAMSFFDQIYLYMYQYRAVPFGFTENFGVKSFHITSDLMGNDMVLNNSAGAFSNHYQYTDHLNRRSTLVSYTWLRFYEVANRANWVLHNIESTAGEASAKEMVKAQALALRAYAHFQLVQVFAEPVADSGQSPGIPYHSEIGLLPPVMQRGTVDEVYQMIVADLDAAIDLLEDKGAQTHRSYIDLAVALGLRARVALVMHDWNEAADFAGRAIEFAEANGKALYTAQAYTADSFNNIEGSEWLWGAEVSAANVNMASFYGHMDVRFSTYARSGIGQQKMITAELYKAFPESDVRKDLFITPGSGSFPEVDYNQMKFLVKEPGSYESDFLFMRLAEMYLIEAEGLARSEASQEEARQVLYELISNRDSAYEISDKSGEELMDEILLHRRLELWGEGQGLTDLRRLGLPLDRPAGAGNHPESLNVLQLDADDESFVWKIPFHSHLSVETEGGGSAEVEGTTFESALFVREESKITLKAEAAPGNAFVSWTLDDEVISEDAEFEFEMPLEDVTLKANFDTGYALTLLVEPAGAGSVSGAGTYLPGVAVDIAATPAEGFRFINWSGNTAGLNDAAQASAVFTVPEENITLTANFETTTDIADVPAEGLKVYPVPTSGQLWVELNLEVQDRLIVELFDVQGRRVLSELLGGSGEIKAVLDLSDLQQGIYLLKFTGKKYNFTRKVWVIQN